MNPNEIISGIQAKNQLLGQKNEELKTLSEDMGRAKRDYAVAYAGKILELKGEGKAATLILDLAKGDKHVAELRYKKDVAKGVYDACRESIKDIRTALDSYRSILTWEREERFSRSV